MLYNICYMLYKSYDAICYFPLAYRRFTPPRESPYLPLYNDILRFFSIRDSTIREHLHYWGMSKQCFFDKSKAQL